VTNLKLSHLFLQFICVYTYDYFDKDDVKRVRAKLWDMGHKCTLHYKTVRVLVNTSF